MRRARPARIRWSPSMIASVPVLQALELVETWFPRASNPEIRAETPLAMICSTIVLPSRRTRPASTSGTSLSPVVSSPPIPVPMMAPVSQSTAEASRSGTSSPASVHASTAARDAKRWLAFMARSRSGGKRSSQSASTRSRSGAPATVQAKLRSSMIGMFRSPDRPSRSASPYSESPMPLGATTPIPVTTTRVPWRLTAAPPFRRSFRYTRPCPLPGASRPRCESFLCERTPSGPGFPPSAPASPTR